MADKLSSDNQVESLKKNYESSASNTKSSKSSSSDEERQYLIDQQRKNRALFEARLEKARLWVLIVFSYYLIRACLVIYPKYSRFAPHIQVMVIIQSILFFSLIIMTLASFKISIEMIQWVLYGQSILLSLSNFNGYDESDT